MAKGELEKIADLLLEGKITPEKAKELTEGSVRAVEFKSNSKIKFRDLGGRLEVLRDEGLIAYSDYHLEKDPFGELGLYIIQAESLLEGEGNFSVLFRGLKSMAYRRGASHISLEVDNSNDRAREIYEHLGFYPLGTSHTVSGNTDRVPMRYDSFNSK